MTTRAILIAASALAAAGLVPGLAPTEAAALTPLALDDDYAAGAEAPNLYAEAAPSAFAPRPDAEYEPNAVIADARAGLQCVPFARAESGVELRGDASTWWRQAKERFETAKTPDEGAVLVLRGYNDPRRGHVAVVKEVVSSRMIIVDHANWLNTGEITRNVPVRDVSVAGDWSRVQVWNVEGQHWGGRAYDVQGFILNIASNDAKEPPAVG